MPLFPTLMLALVALTLMSCGGGGSDSAAPVPELPSPVPIQDGNFELVAGTLNTVEPAGVARCQSGAALGANLGSPPSVTQNRYFQLMAVGGNGHIYLLKKDCDERDDIATLALIEVDLSAGQMRVQQVPYNPRPARALTGDYAEPELTKVFEPVSLAVASDGSVLIGDGFMPPFSGGLTVGGGDRLRPGYGRGIWRFKDGVLSKLAGFDFPAEYWQDGQGGEATFGSLDRICPGPGDAFYVLDRGDRSSRFRKVLLDGTVETLSAQWLDDYPENSLICATDQRAFVDQWAFVETMQSSKWVFGDLGSGQTFSTFSPYPSALLGTFLYGLGDGLVVFKPGASGPAVSVADAKTGVVAPWIESTSSGSYQLDSPPYTLPFSPQIVIDNNNMAYLYSGYALLRYKLPNRLQ